MARFETIGQAARKHGAIDWNISPQAMVDMQNGSPFLVSLAMPGDMDCYTSSIRLVKNEDEGFDEVAD